MAGWGYEDPYERPPVVLPQRPRQNGRLRHGTDAAYLGGRMGPNVVVIDNNQLLSAEGYGQQQAYGRPQRSASMSGERPGNITIINETAASNQAQQEEHSRSPQRQRRPNSVYYDRDGYPVRAAPRRRSVSRHRTPSPYDDYEDEDDVIFVPERERRQRRERRGSRVYFINQPEVEKKDDKKEEKKEEKPKRTAEDIAALKELEALRAKAAEEAQKKKIEEELILKKLKEDAAKAKRESEEKVIRDKAVEDYKKKMAEDEEKEERLALEHQENMIELLRAGNPHLSEREARNFLKKAERNKERGGASPSRSRSRSRSRDPTRSRSRSDELVRREKPRRPVHIKVHSRYLSIETLEAYDLPWGYDDEDPDYFIIKRWISPDEQELLFNHTARLRERKLLAYPKDKLRADANRLAIPKKKDEKKRNKSPIKRTSWIFT